MLFLFFCSGVGSVGIVNIKSDYLPTSDIDNLLGTCGTLVGLQQIGCESTHVCLNGVRNYALVDLLAFI